MSALLIEDQDKEIIVMLFEYPLNISAEISYAEKWAFSRNPAYYNFDSVGGDCTNFVSQCIFTGGAVMNHTPDVGWYYISPNDRAAAWTGVEYFYRFIIGNKSVGPFGTAVPLGDVRSGDVIQLGRNAGGFYHSLLVIDVINGMPFVAAHANDAFNIPLSSYRFEKARCIHITGARKFQ